MLCSNCGFQNPDDHLYCGRCGRRLLVDEFALLAPDALQGERKQVTVMFVDISGFTAMTLERDAEEVVTLVNACLSRLSQCVHRYDGTIDKYIGDAIMAVFGAPRAHEDDPQRAIQAALDIQQALAAFNCQPPLPLTVPLSVHIGISTGYVIAGMIGDEHYQAYTVMGEAVNLAACLDDLADRGQIFVSEGTYRLTSRLFDFVELEPVHLKSWAEPVCVFQVTGVREKAGSMRGLSGLRSRLVGRHAELQRLSSVINALNAGHGGIILVEGEAGIGKSRLVTEVRSSLEGSQPNLLWLEGRGLSYGHSLSFHLPASMLRQYLRLSDDADEGQAWSALQTACAELFAASGEQTCPYLGMLLGLRLPETMANVIPLANPQRLPQRIMDAFGAWAVAAAERVPLVLAFDDMHWADPNSIALIQYLMALCRDHRMLVLCVGRPDRESPFWQVRQQAVEDYPDILIHLMLSPLSDTEVLTLVESLLHLERVPSELADLVLSRAEGNPLFVEEVLRTLIEGGILVEEDGSWRMTGPVLATQIPDTLHGVLAARLDRLDDATKRVVQIAAVIGRVFDRSVLAGAVEDAVCLDDCLMRLQEAEIIRQRAGDPEPEYIFKHTLTQEAAYASLLSPQRKAYHLRVADALARLFWERGEEHTHAGLVATHYERAEAWPRALDYWERAGDSARANYSNQEAIDYYARALEIVARLGDEVTPSQQLALHEKRGQLLAALGNVEAALADYRRVCRLAQQAGDRGAELRALNQIGALETDRHSYQLAGAYFNHALVLARSLGDQAGIAESLNHLGDYYRNMGERQQARECHRQALEIARSLGDLGLLAASIEGLGRIGFMQGRVRASLAAHQQALALRRRLVDRVGLMNTLNALAMTYLWLGDYPHAEETCLEAFDFISRVGDLPVVASLHTYYAASRLYRGDLSKVEAHLLAGLDVARRLDLLSVQAHTLAWLGYYYKGIGQLDRALDLSGRAATTLADLPLPRWQVWAGAVVVAVCTESGKAERALQLAARLLDRADQWHLMPDRAVALAELAQARLTIGQAANAEQVIAELLKVANACDMAEYQIRARWLLGQLRLMQGNPAAALPALTQACTQAEQSEARLLLWRLRATLGDAHWTLSQNDQAEANYRAAWQVLTEIANTLPDPTARPWMLALPAAHRLQGILAAWPRADRAPTDG